MKHTYNANVTCPFYRHEDPSVIYCDGVSDVCRTTLNFETRAYAKDYKLQFCRGDWQECRIAKMLMDEGDK